LFQNLLSNALKFTKKEQAPQIKISHTFLSPTEVSGKHLQPSARYLQINIKDNGIGFEAASSEKIFGLFQRLHGKSAYEGSGLGLAICRRIVENHGGLISATSELGKGSEFTIVLPHS
jgi:signal transduction histidine kinase